MSLQWTPDLAVGVIEIDDQHKELFARVNSLLDAMRQGQGKEQVENTVAFLADYVVTHFAAEERYMLRLRYPDYEAHRKEHEDFIDDFARIKKELQVGGASTSLVIEINRRVGAWLSGHIRRTDKALGAFLSSKLQAA